MKFPIVELLISFAFIATSLILASGVIFWIDKVDTDSKIEFLCQQGRDSDMAPISSERYQELKKRYELQFPGYWIDGTEETLTVTLTEGVATWWRGFFPRITYIHDLKSGNIYYVDTNLKFMLLRRGRPLGDK
jgi:hypothetical protein